MGGSNGVQSPLAVSASGKKLDLLDRYKLGRELGQGAFGIVYECTKLKTKVKYAVKMVDKAETPRDEITRECEMLLRAAHPCVIKLHEIFDEKVFVCMVMDLMGGGDLISGMQDHWESKGTIPFGVTQNIGKQMIAGLAWLHSKELIHRDVKGDNFLMDKPQIEDPACRIYLSDFGSVVPCKPTERLRDPVGTKLYWSPEFYALNYSLKVDVWATGVVMYGLTSGRFPFKNKQDVNSKPIKLPAKFPEAGRELITAMLEKKEDERASAASALQMPYMANIDSPAGKEIQEHDKDFKSDIKRDVATAAVDKRRRELVERLQNANDKKTGGDNGGVGHASPKLVQLEGGGFAVSDNQHGTIKYEWWPSAKVKQHNLVAQSTKPDKEDAGDVRAKTDAILKMLREHNISTSNFGNGKAKTVEQFVDEIARGVSRLMLDATQYKKLVRVVEIVLLRVYIRERGHGKRLLIMTAERSPDGRTKQMAQLPGAKQEPHESGMETARRILNDRLGMSDCKIHVDFNVKERFEEEEESPSYPGVRTVYRKLIFEAKVSHGDTAAFRKLNVKSGTYSYEDSAGSWRSFSWLTESQCDSKRITYQAPADGASVSALVAPPVGFKEDELVDFLVDCGVDVGQFGQGANRSLEEFSAELTSGEAALQKSSNGQLIRNVDVVVLHVTRKSDGCSLVQVEQTLNGKTKTLNRFPATKKGMNDNLFHAAKKVVNHSLRMDENVVCIDPEGVTCVEEESQSASYLGLPTRFQKRFVRASIVEDAFAPADDHDEDDNANNSTSNVNRVVQLENEKEALQLKVQSLELQIARLMAENRQLKARCSE
eukprot:TRINITY_DN27455_c0_g1_i1.p1 TRINITY_DN27455_c0_g1~~TRINITY_DN27455_c0_g1_i1.p1  ORF type:complete len:827 (+),score=155.58 TRINITY_DN27455_c0_g1_i1:47-2527(+)